MSFNGNISWRGGPVRGKGKERTRGPRDLLCKGGPKVRRFLAISYLRTIEYKTRVEKKHGEEKGLGSKGNELLIPKDI
jgi:hypothetical protein